MSSFFKTFLAEKLAPQGHEVPPLWEHYQGDPHLLMPLPLEEDSETLLQQIPETFVIRAQVEIEILSLWPLLEMPDGTALSMEDTRLYSAEAREILRAPRLQKISLIFTGICFSPNRQGSLIPWIEGLGCLPFRKGDVFFSHVFPPIPLSVPFQEKRGGKIAPFSLGGILSCPATPLKVSPLYAFVEGSSVSFPKARLLLRDDLIRLRSIEREDVESFNLLSAEDVLCRGGCSIKTLGQKSFSYDSVQVNVVSGEGDYVDIVMMIKG
jgi:hypothetical protein